MNRLMKYDAWWWRSVFVIILSLALIALTLILVLSVQSQGVPLHLSTARLFARHLPRYPDQWAGIVLPESLRAQRWAAVHDLAVRETLQ